MTQPTQLQLVDHAELNSDVKINAAIKALNALIGGGKVERIDDPLVWTNGATGSSVAYVIPVDTIKIVILSVSNVVTTNITDRTKVATLPESLHIPDDFSVRLSLTEKNMLANQGNSALFFYTTETDKGPMGRWGVAFYVIEDNQ